MHECMACIHTEVLAVVNRLEKCGWVKTLWWFLTRLPLLTVTVCGCGVVVALFHCVIWIDTVPQL